MAGTDVSYFEIIAQAVNTKTVLACSGGFLILVPGLSYVTLLNQSNMGLKTIGMLNVNQVPAFQKLIVVNNDDS